MPLHTLVRSLGFVTLTAAIIISHARCQHFNTEIIGTPEFFVNENAI